MAKAKRSVAPPADALFLTRRMAAVLLCLHISLIDRMIKEERLPAYRIGRRILIRREDLLRVVAESPVWKEARDGER
jgi:excisionase family DNA binding protein